LLSCERKGKIEKNVADYILHYLYSYVFNKLDYILWIKPIELVQKIVTNTGVLTLAETNTVNVAELLMNIPDDLSQRDRLKVLRDIKRDLIAKVREIERIRNDLKTQRDEKNQSVKELFQAAKEIREKRDIVNEDVKLNKAMRDLRQEDITQVVGELEKLENEMKDIGINSNPNKRNFKHSKIAQRINDLEIQQQTQGNLNPKEEKEIIVQIEKLTREAEKLEIVEGKRDEFKTINKKLRKLRSEALGHHKEVQVLAQRSQDAHEEMLAQLKEAKKKRTGADATHKLILEKNDEIKALRKQINKVANETDKLRKLLGEETAVERKKRKQKVAKEQEQELSDKAMIIYERYKSGEKLGFEEFKILISRGLLKD